MYTKNTRPPRLPYRKADSRGDTEPLGGKRGEEESEKPIGRIGKRREKRGRASPPIVKGTRGERRERRVPPSRIGARHGESNRVLRCGGAGKTVRKAGRLVAGYIAIGYAGRHGKGRTASHDLVSARSHRAGEPSTKKSPRSSIRGTGRLGLAGTGGGIRTHMHISATNFRFAICAIRLRPHCIA